MISDPANIDYDKPWTWQSPLKRTFPLRFHHGNLIDESVPSDPATILRPSLTNIRTDYNGCEVSHSIDFISPDFPECVGNIYDYSDESRYDIFWEPADLSIVMLATLFL